MNAWIAAVISALFFAHAILGCVVLFIPSFPRNLEWLVWLGVFLIVVHIVLSVITTWQMFTDTQRPPSARKKGHQVKKWVTGSLLVLVVFVHLALVLTGSIVATRVLALTLVAVAILLCIHLCTGVKSLTRDLHTGSGARVLLRVAAIVLCIILCSSLVLFMI